MEIIKKIAILKKSIKETDQLIEELISSLQAQKLRVENKDKRIFNLKEQVSKNINKIDDIIEKHNANS